MHSVNTHEGNQEIKMKISNKLAKKSSGSQGSQQYDSVSAPIPLERPVKKEKNSSELFKIKLRTSPTDADSSTYEFTMPYYENGTPEEWLEFLRGIKRIIAGLNITSGPSSYAMARQVLQGDALAAFDKAATNYATETVANFKEVLKQVTLHVFPQRALQLQKRYMRRNMRKPKSMTVRAYGNRVVQMRNQLDLYPGGNESGDTLPEDELLDILEHGIPVTWQKEMSRQGFVPIEKTVTEFIEFCERLEFTELNYHEVRTDKHGARPNVGSKSDKFSDAKSQSSKSQNVRSGDNKRKRGANAEDLYCPLHDTHGHDLNSCKVMQSQAKKMRDAYKAANPDGKSAKYTKKREEMNSLIAKAVKTALGEQKKDASKSADNDVDMENFNYDMFMNNNNDSDSE